MLISTARQHVLAGLGKPDRVLGRGHDVPVRLALVDDELILVNGVKNARRLRLLLFVVRHL